MHNTYIPKERILIHQPIGLASLGSVFNAEAPFRACRLCGAVYQSMLDLEQLKLYQDNDGFPAIFFTNPTDYEYQLYLQYQHIEHLAKERRIRWEELHNRRYHNTDKDKLAVQELQRSGAAFTPEAAHRLTSYGIFPTGNMSGEIVDAMATAPRAPIDDPEN